MDGSPLTISPHSPGSGAPTNLFLRLLAAFNQEGISYCYWKSTRRVHSVLSGASDLDLLIARQDQHRAQRIALEQGFKHFPALASRDDPALCSYLGSDEATGRIVHLHLHFRLVIGGSLLKEYRPPWEAMLLKHAVFHPELPIRMLDPASETLLAAVRTCFELRRTDPIVWRRWSETERKFANDLDYLFGRTDPEALRARASSVLSRSAADLLTDTVLRRAVLDERARLRRALRNEIRAWRIGNGAENFVRTLTRAACLAAGSINARFLHQPRPWRRRAPGGGFVVAVLGVDGSGKSTVVRTTRAWLGAEIDVLPVYLGTGDGRPSLLLLPFKLMVPLATRLFATKPKGASHGKTSDRPAGLAYGTLLMIWAGILSLEKRSKLIGARRGAERGLIVLTDRYPQNQDVEYNDGPLLHRVSWAPRWLRDFEFRSYELASRLRPDLVIKLDVTPETAAKREPGMAPALIRQRINSLRQLEFPGVRVVRVDAEQPLDHVLGVVRREIWAML